MLRWSVIALALLAASGTWAQQGSDDTRLATFGGGCFWCMEPPYDKLDGVKSTTSGYMGGELENPTYEQVAGGRTDHVEVVQVEYDQDVVSYGELLDTYWVNVDPLTDNRQFCDSGESYRPVIFVHSVRQREIAEASKRRLIDSGRFDEPVIVPIEDAKSFWPAEDYHQNYYRKSSIKYNYYRWSCGRDDRLEDLWGDPPPDDPDA
ncbi:MAG: peptide-methionine (S)-S-oxide reductase MsrA [Candidatus Wenzhouxiangella sp. M2_3B_020]